MEWFIGLVKSTVEYRAFSEGGLFSWGVMFALGTVILTCAQGYGVVEQGKTIWRKRSAKSVSSLMVISGVGYFLSFIVYGILETSIAAVFNGLLGFAFIPATVGYWKFRGFQAKEWIYTAIFLAYIPMMALIKDRELFLLIALFSLLFAAIPQTVEAYHAWKDGDPGAIEPKFFIMFIVASVFWFGYGVEMSKRALQIFNPFSVANLGLALLFWWLARKRARQAAKFVDVSRPTFREIVEKRCR